METNVLSGLLLILLAGSCSGDFSVPFKFNRGWAWENNWFIWSFAALLVMPWLMAWLTVPRLETLYGADPHSTSLVALFGLTWGVGAILFGKGIDYLGISLSLPIMQGLINSIGTLMPIVLRDPSELATPAGLRILAGVAVILAGIILFALAGSRKEQSEGSRQTGAQSRSRFRKGLVICLLAGIFGPMINFAFVYGAPLQQQAVALGADPVYAGNAVWSVALTAGFLINAAECIRLFRRNRTWKHYASRRVPGITLAAVAGIVWYMSIMLYGMGGNRMGEAGASVGWAVMQSVAIIAGNAAGICSGEWRATTRHAQWPMAAGLCCLVLGVVILSRGL